MILENATFRCFFRSHQLPAARLRSELCVELDLLQVFRFGRQSIPLSLCVVSVCVLFCFAIADDFAHTVAQVTARQVRQVRRSLIIIIIIIPLLASEVNLREDRGNTFWTPRQAALRDLQWKPEMNGERSASGSHTNEHRRRTGTRRRWRQKAEPEPER